MKRLMTLTTALLFWTTVAAQAQQPEFYRLSVSGTNGVTQVQARNARPFLPTKVVVAGVAPTNATVIVQRERGVVVEAIGTVTAVNGAATLVVTNGPVLYAGDLLRVNGPGLGTATNATVEIHGVRY